LFIWIKGTPVKIEVLTNDPAMAHGDGLVSAVKDKVATFIVDGKGHRGEIVVQVDGKYRPMCA
jgi:hypothetical protein